MNQNLYVLQIPRQDVENKDIGMITHYIKQLEKIKAPAQCVEITFSGYDDTTDEVYEIQDIRAWVSLVLKEAPEILFYTAFHFGTTMRILNCAYDFSHVKTRLMNAHEATDYFFEHGNPLNHPVMISVPSDELLRLYGAIKMYGIKRKNEHGAGQVVQAMKDTFDSYKGGS